MLSNSSQYKRGSFLIETLFVGGYEVRLRQKWLLPRASHETIDEVEHMLVTVREREMQKAQIKRQLELTFCSDREYTS